jgi:recombination protein RecR
VGLLLPGALDRLVMLLSRLPGVGERTAMRLAFFIIEQPDGYAKAMGTVLGEVEESISFCSQCHMLSEGVLCPICLDNRRDKTLLMVVEHVQDVIAFERTGAYDGLYHVLHGTLAPLKGIGPADLRVGDLPARVGSEGVKEVILATNTSVEGEATALYLARCVQSTDVQISRIATGIPMGGELEYTDQHTLSQALLGRRPIT